MNLNSDREVTVVILALKVLGCTVKIPHPLVADSTVPSSNWSEELHPFNLKNIKHEYRRYF